MPPRLLVLAILVFWLSTTSWLCYREIWPRFRAGEAPPYTIDLTDEVGANTIEWKLYQKGERVGTSLSWVRRQPDRTFEIGSELKFQSMDFLVFRIRRITWTYRVTADGNLVGLAGVVKFGARGDDSRKESDHELSVNAPVEEGSLKPVVFLNEAHLYTVAPMPLSQRGSVLSPAGMLNKIEGLKPGQTWQMPLLDSLPVGLPGKDLLVPKVYAEVFEDDTLHWPGSDAVSCLRIDYHKPPDDKIASTWVRRRDGLVIRQQVNLHGMELVLVRDNR